MHREHAAEKEERRVKDGDLGRGEDGEEEESRRRRSDEKKHPLLAKKRKTFLQESASSLGSS